MNFKQYQKRRKQHFVFFICSNDLDFAEEMKSGFLLKTTRLTFI